MKLEIKSGNVTTSEQFKEITFGIRSADMGIILEILRSKMYKNPIAAICREIASNARDANKEVGNKNPITINIDEGNIFEHICESSISFIDNGPGISPERMSDVFVNYGASTKRDDNRQLGGFGLGAKTPFAYTDNFTIITIVNGTKYQYVAAIEENNTGKIYLLEESTTTEPNGTTIIIPIKRDDIRLFKQELTRATYFWPIKPNFNFEFELDIHCTYVQNGILLKDNSELFTNNLYALIDGLPYEVDSDKITSIRYSSYTIMLTFRTGTLAISANRESIRYDDDTLKKIQEKYEHFVKNLQEKTQNEIDTAANYYEAAIKLYQITQSDELTKVLYDNHIVPFYKGQKVNFNLFLPDGLELTKIYRAHDSSSSRKVIRQLEPGMTTIYLIDVNKPTAGRNLTIFNSLANKDHFYYLDISNKLLKSFSNQNYATKRSIAKSVRQIVNQIKWFKSIGLTLINYSSIKPTRILREQRVSSIIPSKVLRSTGRHFSIYNNKPLVACKVDINTITSATHVYRVFEDRMNHISREILKWTNVFATCGIKVLFVSNRRGTQLSKIIKSHAEMIDKLDLTKATEITDSYIAHEFKKSLDGLSAFDFGPVIKSSLDLVKKKAAACTNEDLPVDFVSKYPASPELQQAIKLINELKLKYPLLQKYNEYSDKENISVFNDYIRLIDAREQYERNKMVADTGTFDFCLQGQIVNN